MRQFILWLTAIFFSGLNCGCGTPRVRYQPYEIPLQSETIAFDITRSYNTGDFPQLIDRIILDSQIVHSSESVIYQVLEKHSWHHYTGRVVVPIKASPGEHDVQIMFQANALNPTLKHGVQIDNLPVIVGKTTVVKTLGARMYGRAKLLDVYLIDVESREEKPLQCTFRVW